MRAKEDKSSTAWARAGAKKGARPPYERPPALALRLPRAYPKQAEGQSFHEIGDHPWAGMTVELTLVAKDLAGQTGRSEPIEVVLPERRFSKPLARAVVEQRRRLAEDPRDRLQVARAHRCADARARGVHRGSAGLSWACARPTGAWSAKRRAAARNSVIAQLWNIALRIEDGNLTDAERALRAAQERLSKALEEGASDEEIQKLMQELRQALAQFLEQLSKQAQNQPPMQGLDRNSQFLTPARPRADAAQPREHGALGQSRHGPADAEPAARPARSAAVRPHGRPGSEPALRPDDGRVRQHHRPQQQLLDDTFGQQRRQGERGQRGQGQRGQQGQQGQQGQGQQARARARAMATSRVRLGDRQRRAARHARPSAARHARVRAAMRPGSSTAPARPWSAPSGRCATAISMAPPRRRRGRSSSCGRVLARWPSRCCARCRRATGSTTPQGELDPMGRPPQRTDGPDPGVGVKVPDQIDIQRAREILEELRRRLGESTRPPLELEYLERLLKRF